MSYGSPLPPDYPPPYGAAPRQHGSAVTALVLGIVGLVSCGLLGIPAYIIGRRAEREILASNGALTGDGMARAGWVCGVVAMALTAAALLLFVLLFAFSGAMMFSTH